MTTSDAIVEELFAFICDEKNRDGTEELEDAVKKEERKRESKKKKKKQKKHKKHRNKEPNESMDSMQMDEDHGRDKKEYDMESVKEVKTSKRRRDDDVFWDSTWDAIQLQTKANKLERVGKHLCEELKRRRRSTSPHPSMEKRDQRSRKTKRRHSTETNLSKVKDGLERRSSPETEEFRRLRRLRDLQELRVAKVYADRPEDPTHFEWDHRARMRRRKHEIIGQSPNDRLEAHTEGFQRDGNKRTDMAECVEEGEIESDDERHQSPSRSRQRYRSREWSHSRYKSIERHRSRSGQRSHGRRRSESRKGTNRSQHRLDDSYRIARSVRDARSGCDRRRRSRSRHRSRRASRSPSRPRLHAYRSSRHSVDKDRLLAIARRNAAKLLNSNDRMGIDRERLVAIKAGGQSLDELTDFCRELAKKGFNEEEEECDHDSQNAQNEYRHPFEVKERPLPSIASPFMLGYRSGSRVNQLGIEMESMTPQMKSAAKTHRMIEFPVSSGNAHRVKETQEATENKKIKETDEQDRIDGSDGEKLENNLEATAVKCDISCIIEEVTEEIRDSNKCSKVSDQNSSDKSVEVNVVSSTTEELMATEEQPTTMLSSIMFRGQEPKANILAALQKPNDDTSVAVGKTVSIEERESSKTKECTKFQEKDYNYCTPLQYEIVNEDVKKTRNEKGEQQMLTFEPSKVSETSSPTTIAGSIAESSEASSSFKDQAVFEKVEAPSESIGALVGSRLSAMRKLSSNPTDPEALVELYEAQKQLSAWASSKNKPGLFSGHTGAKVLSKGELNQGLQAWAKQQQFTEAKRVEGGFGEFMLRKMGWQQGEGLGKNRSGDVDPLTLDIKYDKKGLMAAEEGVYKGWNTKKSSETAFSLSVVKDLSGKHPVSALIELATKRKWGPPVFEQAFEVGPPHKKQFIFKVNVNGVDYQPSIATDNKKKAKADAAAIALRQMGMLPDDPDNPL